MKYEKMELHLAPFPLSRAHAKRIKACGGKYSECRGYASKRFVTVPASERDLINDLVVSYASGRKTTMIARGEHGRVGYPSWVVVQNVDPRFGESPVAQFETRYAKAYDQAVKRGIIKPEHAERHIDDLRAEIGNREIGANDDGSFIAPDGVMWMPAERKGWFFPCGKVEGWKP